MHFNWAAIAIASFGFMTTALTSPTPEVGTKLMARQLGAAEDYCYIKRAEVGDLMRRGALCCGATCAKLKTRQLGAAEDYCYIKRDTVNDVVKREDLCCGATCA